MTHRLAIIHDIHVTMPDGQVIGWAYFRRSQALARYAPADFAVETFQFSEVPWSSLGKYDCILNLEYAAPSRDKIKKHAPNAALIVSFNSDARRRGHMWANTYKEADWVIINNCEMYEHKGRLPRTCCISNGVDTDIFRPTTQMSERDHKCIFAGSSGVTKQKGFSECFWPLEKILPQHGFTTDFRPINDINPDLVMPVEKTVAWYNSASYVLCASLSEGTPNLVSEAVACGCVAVSLPVGNIQEWGQDGTNCVLCERTPESFVAALQFARDNRERLSAAGMNTLRNGWSYGEPGNRAAYFFNLFRRIITGNPPKPFSYSEVAPEDI